MTIKIRNVQRRVTSFFNEVFYSNGKNHFKCIEEIKIPVNTNRFQQIKEAKMFGKKVCTIKIFEVLRETNYSRCAALLKKFSDLKLSGYELNLVLSEIKRVGKRLPGKGMLITAASDVLNEKGTAKDGKLGRKDYIAVITAV